MTDSLGVALTGAGLFYKNAVLTDPSSAPVLRTQLFPDLSELTPGSALTHIGTGIYGGALFSAVQNTQFGNYLAELYSSDATLDNQVSWVQFEVRPVPATAGASVTLSSSIDSELNINIQQGDAIIAGSPNQIQWTDTDATWSALAIDTVTLYLSTQPGYANEIDVPATYDALNATITLDDLSSSDTSNLKLTTYTYRLRAEITPASDGPVTLVTGKFTVARAA